MNRLNSISAQMNSYSKRDLLKYFDHHSTEEISLRELEETDFNNGFLSLFEQSKKPLEISSEDFKKILNSMKSSPNLHLVIVGVDKKSKTIVGAGTLIIEKKFIRDLGIIGHIEDVSVDTNWVEKNVGKAIVECLTRIAFEAEKVYKCIVGCSEKNVPFFQQVNFKIVQKNMAISNQSFDQKYTRI